MNKFANSAREVAAHTTTTNGANALNTTGSHLVDLFGSAGAMRGKTTEIRAKFSEAFNENPDLATKMAFYVRDVRSDSSGGGLGERDTAKQMWLWLANNKPDTMRKNMKYIPMFGRWDDLYIFIGTPVEEDMWNMIKTQLSKDIVDMRSGKPVSLLAKWMKSINTKSKDSVRIARMTANKFGMKYHQYQKTLAHLRRYIDVTEVKMTSGEWSNIHYENVPSRAMSQYNKAFVRHDYHGFTKYLSDVKAGKKNIKAATLFPHDIVGKYMTGRMEYYYNKYFAEVNSKIDEVAEAQWKALPNYVKPGTNALVIADTSGSMRGLPINAALGLAIYFAERNRGDFHNLFMTFSRQPEFIELSGDTLLYKLQTAARANWGQNTNFEAALDLVFNTAIHNHISPEDMPKALVVISDMQFDQATSGGFSTFRTDWTFYDQMKQKYARFGYTIPHIVFWNVNDYGNYTSRYNYEGVSMFSGYSASTFRDIINSIECNPYESMVKTLTKKRYEMITA